MMLSKISNLLNAGPLQKKLFWTGLGSALPKLAIRDSEATPLRTVRGAASHFNIWMSTVRQSLTALCGGRAAGIINRYS